MSGTQSLLPEPSPFRLAVAGSRLFTDAAFLDERLRILLANRLPDVAILHGGYCGVDQLAGAWAEARGLAVEVFEPGSDWNRDMIQSADALLAFVSPESVGTRHAIAAAMMERIPVVVYECEMEGGKVKRATSYTFNRR